MIRMLLKVLLGVASLAALLALFGDLHCGQPKLASWGDSSADRVALQSHR